MTTFSISWRELGTVSFSFICKPCVCVYVGIGAAILSFQKKYSGLFV